MRRIGINLASRPLRNQILPAALLAAAGVGALVFTTFNVVLYTTRARAAQAYAAEAASAERELASLAVQRRDLVAKIGASDASTLARDVAAVNSLLRRRGFSWTALFNELERVQPYYVQLETVQPSAAGEEISLRISGAAKRYEDFLDYINRLEASPAFSEVYPVNERMMEKGVGYRFQLTMRYHPFGGHGEGEGVGAPARKEGEA